MLNDISNFRFYAHKVLPLVYDDSLSYYEFLCKVVAKLNEVIDLADQQNSTIEEIVEDVEDFEAETNTKYNQFVAQIEADLEAFETEMRTAQSDYETEISGEMTEFEGTMQDLYDEFLENYQRTFGIQDSFGTSTTDAISQACVSQLIDYTGETPIVKGANLPIDDTTSGADKLWSSDKIEDEIEEVNTDLSTDIDAIETRMDTAESDIDTLESGLQTANSNISGLNSVTTTLAGQVAGIAGNQELLSGRVGTLETSVGTLSSDVTSLSTQVTQMDTDVDNLQDNVLELRNDVDTNTGKIADIEDNIDTLDTTVGIVRDDLDSAEGDIATLQSNLSYESGRIDGLNTRLGIAETDINNLEDDMSTAEANIANLDSRMDTAEDDIDTLEGRMSTAEDDIDSLETRMTTAENDIDSLEENKANRVGDEELLISGGSRGLLFGKITDGEPYNYRVTAGGKSVGNLKKVKNLVGGTLALNQLANPINTHTTNDVTCTKNDDETITLNGTANADGTLGTHSYTTPRIAGHKYLICMNKEVFDTGATLFSSIAGTNTLYSQNSILVAQTDGLLVASVRASQGTVFDNVNCRLMVIDLTTLFGTIPQTVGVTNYNSIADYISAIETTNSGAGIAWLYKYFPILNDGYIPNTEANLQSVCCDKSITEEHEYIMGHETLRGVYMLDSNGNLYCDPTKNDTKTSDGTITRRVKHINLGDCVWTYFAQSNVFYTTVSDAEGIAPTATKSGNIICEEYISETYARVIGQSKIDKSVVIANTTKYLYLYNSAKSASDIDANGHASWLENVFLEYPLSNPTTENGTPYTELQICKTDGTEELTDYEVEEGNRVVAIPVGHSTEYDKDIAPELNNLLSILPTANDDYLLNVNNGVYSFQSATNRSIETLTPIEKIKEGKTEITSEEIPEERSEENEELSD